MSIETWLAFFVACWIISLSPGAGAIASMSSGLNYGFARGYWTALGLQLGLVVQIAVVAAGVGAVLAASALAFTLIKWFGVLYLLYLAWRQWRAPTMQVDETQAPRALGQPLALVFRGLLINVSNPKAVVFMLAVLPQFLDVSRPLLSQYLIMGLTMITVDLIVMAGYTGLAARVLRLLRSPRQQRLLNRTFAGLFAAAAGMLTLVRRAT
ncbi:MULTISPECIES: LysE family transporter [Halopseudomonas]|jgi:homoserine/homoserine lactone efflux protein|uniref:Homoserine/homoserine lactone efflux protein n=1 Tax=Halopseudomonas aestusnigri TaxID=857252 RepID=A0AAQ1G797_9GAMM|nr:MULTISPECIES: LysE family transporter [Halopseudomonas]MAP77746.1 threonine transporter RhtB [Pseudomonadales bacterium]MEE2799702.1 LysE family transporter [Pseudomonadota bacterium]HCP03362.1 threonine transporter RhtB [Pseudomonas sp.]MDL2198280.1 LysE family transporter [Halopseudomonas aestusnigri]OWL89364.1 threonine transporter RhtB [Halopseudomonas aestusnigri]|tara:strand:+ start:730 stop:1359 length:630 start_codon:yes stop_codon:yes gene_type:complete